MDRRSPLSCPVGGLRQLNWSPGINTKSLYGPGFGEGESISVEDVIIERVFAAMNFIEEHESQHFAVMRLTYRDQLNEKNFRSYQLIKAKDSRVT
jgi:hypothetical protein